MAKDMVWKSVVIGLLSFGLATQISLAQEIANPKPATPTASQSQDEAQKLLTQARNFAMNGRIDDALQAFTRAAEIRNGKCAECFQGIGMAYFQFSQFKEASEALKQAIALKPDNEAVVMNLYGVALYLQDEKNTLGEAITAFQKAIELSKDSLPKAHYNLGFALLKSGRDSEGIDELKKYVALEPSSPNAKSARDVISNPKLAKVQMATDFKVKAADGKELSLKNLRGKVVLLDFWASWCGPCRIEMPAVKRVWKQYGGDHFVILGINLDQNKEAFSAYVKSEDLTWPQYFDGLGWDNKISRLYGVRSIPHTVLIDQEGAIRAVGLRGTTLYKKIADLLNQMKEPKPADAK